MYSSLTKIDIVGDPGGVRHFIQTDHRTTEEIDAEPEISAIFALTRTIAPRRMVKAGDPKTVVRYVALGGLHPIVARVLAATGAEAEAEGRAVSLDTIAPVPAADLADEAFASLARRAIAREGLALDEAGLEAFEKQAAGTPRADEDEIAYWTGVAELAAVTGEVLRARFGGRWVDDPKCFADIPFMFRLGDGDQLLNAVGKAVKFLDVGERESPRQLLRMAADASAARGPLLFTFKPASWPGAADAVCEKMVPDWEKMGADVPLVVYGDDMPSSFAMYTKGGKEERDLPDLRQRALVNLAKVEVSIEDVRLDGLEFLVVHGGYYAAEKLLDVAFMQSLHTRLRSGIIAAAIPRKGELFVTDAIVQRPTMFAFFAVVEGTHKRQGGGPPLSPTVFLVQEGKVVGVAKAAEDAPPTEKKGFFKRLFS